MPLDLSHFQSLSDSEILNLARDEAHLTDEAKQALSLELSKRNITFTEVQAYNTETTALEAQENAEVSKFLAPRGMNKKFLGRTNFTYDPDSDTEEYVSTTWFTVFWFPLIPLGTYRVRRNRSQAHWWNLFDAEISIVEKLQRNWDQILVTWIKAVFVLLVLRVTLPFVLPWILDRLNHSR